MFLCMSFPVISDVDPCLSSPCLNDGQCLSVPDDGSYLCLCTPGNVGVNCMGQYLISPFNRQIIQFEFSPT